MSGEGATGGAINYVTKQPHTGPIRNEAFTFLRFAADRSRVRYGSGGSTTFRGWTIASTSAVPRSMALSTTPTPRRLNISGQLNYRVSDSFKIWGAIEYKQDKGTVLLGHAAGADRASADRMRRRGIVSGNYVSNYNGTNLGAGHDRRPHLQHELQRPRQPVTAHRSCGCAAASNWNISTRPDAEEPGLWLRRQARLVQQRGRGFQRQCYRTWSIASASIVAHRPDACRQHHRPDLGREYRRHGQPPGHDLRGQQSRFRPAGRRQLSGRLRSRWSIPTAASTACSRHSSRPRASTTNRCRSKTG